MTSVLTTMAHHSQTVRVGKEIARDEELTGVKDDQYVTSHID